MSKAKPKNNSSHSTRNVLVAVAVTAVITVLVFSLLLDRGYLGGLSGAAAGEYPDANPFGDQQGSQQGPQGSPYVPGNPTLQIQISPSIVDRTESVSFSVSSNLGNVPVQVQVLYEGVNAWFNAYTLNLPASGHYNAVVPMGLAGDWQVKAKYGAVESNVEHVTVLGITIYQQKDTWVAGENYSAALTGTYKNWRVAVFVKDSASSSWVYALSALSDVNGRIPYNMNSVTIGAAQVGKDKDVICVISSSDASGSDLPDLFYTVEGVLTFTTSQLDGLVSQGRVVKSNILTVHIR